MVIAQEKKKEKGINSCQDIFSLSIVSVKIKV